MYLTVHPEMGAAVNECFWNVETKIEHAGGSMLCGWQIWEWPHVLVEAEFHAIWLSPDGDMIDITPKQHGETKILFAPDHRRRYSGLVTDNVRIPLRDDQLILHFIKIAEAITRVMNLGDRAEIYGHVSIPANEIEPLQMAQSFLGNSIALGLRDHDLCLCGSKSKYKRCHSRQISRLLDKS